MQAYEYINESPPFKVRRRITGSSCLNRSSASAEQRRRIGWELTILESARKMYSTDHLAADSLTYADAPWVKTWIESVRPSYKGMRTGNGYCLDTTRVTDCAHVIAYPSQRPLQASMGLIGSFVKNARILLLLSRVHKVTH